MMEKTTKRTILMILLVGGFCYFFGGLTVYKQIFPYTQMTPIKRYLFDTESQSTTANTAWQERREQFKIYVKQADVVMIGDSITHAGHWEEIFPDVKIANRAIGGDKTSDILDRMSDILLVKPRKAFIMIGINDLGQSKSVDEIFNNYSKIVEQLQNRNIVVIIQSTLECGKCGIKLRHVRSLNGKLKEYADRKHLKYININSGLTSVEDGLLSQYTYDGIHLLGNGYVKWVETIAEEVNRK